MHEIRLLRTMLDDLFKTAKEQNTAKITKVYLKMGALTELTPEIITSHFGEMTKGTIAEGAEISITPSLVRELRLVSFDCE